MNPDNWLNEIRWTTGRRRLYYARTRSHEQGAPAVYRAAKRQLRRLRAARKQRRGWA